MSEVDYQNKVLPKINYNNGKIWICKWFSTNSMFDLSEDNFGDQNQKVWDLVWIVIPKASELKNWLFLRKTRSPS